AALGSWPNFRHEGRPRQMLYAGLDIHKAVFQAAVLDPDSGELSESRFEPSRERLTDWAMQWQGKLAAVAIEATTGWRWVARELQAHGFEVRLVDPGRASALRGRRRQPKTELLAEIGDVTRFQRPRQLVRASGLDPSVIESADSKRRGRLAKQGSRHLRWALVEAANHSHRSTSPDHELYRNTVRRCGRGRARLTVARKIARRSYHVLLAAEAA